MSLSISTIINDAAVLVSDVAFSRVLRSDWLLFYNFQVRRLAREMRLVEYEATFTVVADDLYSLPSDCVRIKGIEFNESPSTAPRDWKGLKEKFEDEFRSLTDGHYPTGTPSHYFMRQGFFHLYPCPQATVAGGGRLKYWGVPADAVDSSEPVPFPETVRDVCLLGMLSLAFNKLKMFEDAAKKEAEFEAAIAKSRDALEDRSEDRRTQVRAAHGIGPRSR